MKEIAFKSEVLLFLDELIISLVEKEYFGFIESAEEYVNNLYDAILNNLPGMSPHQAPQELIHYGKYYIKIKVNKRTTWYVFFETLQNRYLIQFITNNHTPQSESYSAK